jgi:hypothetical protein
MKMIRQVKWFADVLQRVNVDFRNITVGITPHRREKLQHLLPGCRRSAA